MSVFLDTGFYIAFYNLKDKYHKRAMEVFNILKNNQYGKIYTSGNVIDELLTYFQRRVSQASANRISQLWFVKAQGLGTILFSNLNILEEAAKTFSSQRKEIKQLSFTDCLILSICRENNISNLVSFESGFHNLINVVQ